MLRAQDDQLRAMVKLHGGRNWKKIAEDLVNKTDVQCLHRWQKVLNPELVKGPWQKEASNPTVPVHQIIHHRFTASSGLAVARPRVEP